jgi:signal peptidase I
MNDNLLTHAQMALERNDKFEATQLFRLHITHYPDIAVGWLGLFQSSDQHAEQIECLEQLLRITHAEYRATDSQVEGAAGGDTFESIDGDPASEFELLKPYAETTPKVAEPNEDSGITLDVYEAVEPIEEELKPGWPTIKTQIVERIAEMVDAGNQLMQVIDTELASVMISLKQKAAMHPFFTTQFSTSYGRKLRRVPTPRLHKLPKVLNWVWWVAGLLVLGVLAAAVVPVFIGNKALVIISGSMVPAISTGSVVVVSPVDPNQLAIGDVIAYSPDAGSIPIVHRIIGIREEAGTRFFTTQGDANQTADAKEVALPTTAWKLWYSVPWLGYVINFSFSRTGFVMMVIVPLLGLGALMLKDKLRQPAKRRLLKAY